MAAEDEWLEAALARLPDSEELTRLRKENARLQLDLAQLPLPPGKIIQIHESHPRYGCEFAEVISASPDDSTCKVKLLGTEEPPVKKTPVKMVQEEKFAFAVAVDFTFDGVGQLKKTFLLTDQRMGQTDSSVGLSWLVTDGSVSTEKGDVPIYKKQNWPKKFKHVPTFERFKEIVSKLKHPAKWIGNNELAAMDKDAEKRPEDFNYDITKVEIEEPEEQKVVLVTYPATLRGKSNANEVTIENHFINLEYSTRFKCLEYRASGFGLQGIDSLTLSPDSTSTESVEVIIDGDQDVACFGSLLHARRLLGKEDTTAQSIPEHSDLHKSLKIVQAILDGTFLETYGEQIIFPLLKPKALAMGFTKATYDAVDWDGLSEVGEDFFDPNPEERPLYNFASDEIVDKLVECHDAIFQSLRGATAIVRQLEDTHPDFDRALRTHMDRVSSSYETENPPGLIFRFCSNRDVDDEVLQTIKKDWFPDFPEAAFATEKTVVPTEQESADTLCIEHLVEVLGSTIPERINDFFLNLEKRHPVPKKDEKVAYGATAVKDFYDKAAHEVLNPYKDDKDSDDIRFKNYYTQRSKIKNVVLVTKDIGLVVSAAQIAKRFRHLDKRLDIFWHFYGLDLNQKGPTRSWAVKGKNLTPKARKELYFLETQMALNKNLHIHLMDDWNPLLSTTIDLNTDLQGFSSGEKGTQYNAPLALLDAWQRFYLPEPKLLIGGTGCKMARWGGQWSLWRRL